MGKKSSSKLIEALSAIFSRLTRPIRNINIISRTDQILSKDKPSPAPHFDTIAKQKELVEKMYPKFMENHYKKNMQLDEYLKNVYVTSNDPEKLEEESNSSKLLPQRRSRLNEAEFPYENIQRIPEGKCSLRDAVDFIQLHAENPKEYSIEKIAAEYKLDKQVVANILKHFMIPVLLDLSPEKDKESATPPLLEKY